jgi:ATP-binding cassette subfamily B protein
MGPLLLEALWLLLLHIGLGLLLTGCEMVIPTIIRLFVDEVLPAADKSLFNALLAGLLVIIAVLIGMRASRNLLERTIREKAARDLQLTVFRKLRELGFHYYEQHAVGESLSLMNTEVTAVQRLYHRHFPEWLKCMLYVAVIIVILGLMHMPLVLWSIPWFILYAIIGPMLERKTMQTVRATTEARIGYNQSVYDSMSAQLEIRAHGRRDWNRQRLLEQLGGYLQIWRKMTTYIWLRGVPRRIIVYGSTVTMYAYGAVLVRDGVLSIGEFVAFALYYTIMIFNMTLMITIAAEARALMAQAERLYRLDQLKAELVEAERPILLPKVSGNLSFQAVSFRYPAASRDMLVHFTLNITNGERIAIVGESGGGKSTLLKLIGRFYDPYAGDILLDGVRYCDLSIQQLRESIGFVFQETYLFGTSIRDNIRFACPEASDEQVVEAAKAAYAHSFIEQLPDGYDTEVGERGYKLSGGQKQRLAIARMYLKNPPIIVLDEATSALDNESERAVMKSLDGLLQGKTIIAIAHRISTIRHYDRIVMMEQGRIAEIGSYDELMRRQGAFFRMVEGGAKAI